MKNKKAVLFTTLLLFVAFIGCDSKTEQAQVIEPTNKEVIKLDSYTLTTITGKKISFEVSNGVLFSKQLNGKMVLINFWAPWCKPCVKEMPTFVELQEKYKDNFTIVAVLFDKKLELAKLKEFMKKHNVNFPVTIGEENFVLAKAFDDVKMIPESFLYNKEGFFLEKFIGEINKSKLENYIIEDI
jgi:thiol-disulfide isomerase/thioredoxin